METERRAFIFVITRNAREAADDWGLDPKYDFTWQFHWIMVHN
jgi:hypothetical protein